MGCNCTIADECYLFQALSPTYMLRRARRFRLLSSGIELKTENANLVFGRCSVVRAGGGGVVGDRPAEVAGAGLAIAGKTRWGRHCEESMQDMRC